MLPTLIIGIVGSVST